MFELIILTRPHIVIVSISKLLQNYSCHLVLLGNPDIISKCM
jgi:hypothetical protein